MAGEKAGERMNDLYALHMSRSDSQQRKRSRKPESRRRKTVKRCVCWGLFVLILGLAAWNLIRYPLRGNTYDVLGINREEITEVKIFHYGRMLHVADEERLGILLSLFDCSLERGSSDYICHTTGGDWGVSFITREGKQSKSFTFFPSAARENAAPAKMFIGRYYYICDRAIHEEIPLAYWEAAFKKELEQ